MPIGFLITEHQHQGYLSRNIHEKYFFDKQTDIIMKSVVTRGDFVEDRTGKNGLEKILAFELYCRTSFANISKTNKDIINLANFLGRTPSSVALQE